MLRQLHSVHCQTALAERSSVAAGAADVSLTAASWHFVVALAETKKFDDQHGRSVAVGSLWDG